MIIQHPLNNAAYSKSVQKSFNKYIHLHKEVDLEFKPSVDKFVNDGLLVALNRHALGISSCKGFFYNLLFDWTEELDVEALFDRESPKYKKSNDHSRYILEQIVPIAERKKFGEHFTPPEIVDFIITKTINKEVTSTLDPAVGSGAFLIGWLKYQLNSNIKSKVKFTGYDTNPASLAISELNLEAFLKTNPNLTDKIQVHLAMKDSLKTYFKKNSLLTSDINRNVFDAIIGNPPYVRVHNIQPAQKRNIYRMEYFETAKGRFDLYMLFIEMADRALTERGRLGYIISNKIMTSNSAKGVRNYLNNKFNFEYIIDLGDSKLFQAAILPLIIIARKGKKNISKNIICANLKEIKKSNNSKISPTVNTFPLLQLENMDDNETLPCKFQDKNKINHICSIEKIGLDQRSLSKTCWHLNNKKSDEIIKKIESYNCRLESLCTTISAGIKSTADDIFCKPITENFIFKNKLERDFVYPYLQAKNISKWKITWTGKVDKKDTYIIYPHSVKNGKTVPVELSIIPNIAKWLKKNKNQLIARKYVLEAGRKWYEIWVPQKASYFKSNFKIVTPDFSTNNRFALDTKGYWCGGNSFMIIPKNQNKDWAFYLLGLMNSSVLEYFHKKAASSFVYGERYRYTSTSIKKYPIVMPNKDQMINISIIVQKLIHDPLDFKLFDKLNSLVSNLYKLNKDEMRIINNQINSYI